MNYSRQELSLGAISNFSKGLTLVDEPFHEECVITYASNCSLLEQPCSG
jgi:hypothetical protein